MLFVLQTTLKIPNEIKVDITKNDYIYGIAMQNIHFKLIIQKNRLRFLSRRQFYENGFKITKVYKRKRRMLFTKRLGASA